jgi:hypothetical protein
VDLITDEELAKLELRYAHMDHVRRLITALRASREEVELKGYDHAAFFPTLVVPAGGVTIAGPLSEPLLLVPAPPEG